MPRHALVVLLALLLSACMSVPQQRFNKAANPHVRKVALVPANKPSEYLVQIIHHPGMGFGLIGGLVAAADMTSKTNEFTTRVSGDRLDLASVLTDAVRAELAQTGSFEVDVATLDRGTKPAFVKTYPDAGADAYLDVMIRQAGYIAQYPSSPYLPTIYAPVQLVEAKTGRVLYTTEFAYTDSDFVFKGSTHLQPDTSFAFADFSALSAGREHAAEGLKAAARQIARQIATDLRSE